MVNFSKSVESVSQTTKANNFVFCIEMTNLSDLICLFADMWERMLTDDRTSLYLFEGQNVFLLLPRVYFHMTMI